MVNLRQNGTCKSKTGETKMAKLFVQKLFAVSLCMAMAVLGVPRGQSKNVADAVDPTEVQVTPESITIAVGEIVQLSAKVLPEGAEYDKLEWSYGGDGGEVEVLDPATGLIRGVAVTEGEVSVYAVVDQKTAGTCRVTVVAGDGGGGLDFGEPVPRADDDVVQYVTAAGRSSVSVSTANLNDNGILWLLEDSAGKSAWYGLDLSGDTPAFELDKGSRFYVQWLSPTDEGYADVYAGLDANIRSKVKENNNLIFLVGVEDYNGEKIQPAQPVKLYVQYGNVGGAWNQGKLKSLRIDLTGEDTELPVETVKLTYPGADEPGDFGVITLDHFSPHILFEATGSWNVKTGDYATQIAVAGLGAILVLALGIMMRLITSKKKLEE